MTIRHFIIPDVQAKPDVSLEYLTWIGKYIVDKKPEVIICLGDFSDMPSLSSYDKGTKSFEGRRYKKDIAAATSAMEYMLAPLKAYNDHKRKMKEKLYKPRMVMILGNHEDRITRACNMQAELDGLMSLDQLPYGDWEVIDYLKPMIIDDIQYIHFNPNPMTGRPRGGKALNQLEKVGKSFVCGHQQILDVATRFLPDGTQQWGIIAGACYQHQEEYKGHVGNHHWRGCIMANDVHDGTFDPMFISLDYLERRYGNL
jgi:hypothetical protein